MTNSELLSVLSQYPDQMTATQRAAAYARGERVDHLPVSISCNEVRAGLYGYTMGEYRRSFDVRATVYQNMHRDFGTEGITIGTGLRKMGEALGARACCPENTVDYLLGPVYGDYWDRPAPLAVPNPRKSPVLSEVLREIGRFLGRFGSGLPIKTDVAGPMTTASFICGTMGMLREGQNQPEKLHRVLDFSVDCQLAWVQEAYEMHRVASVSVSDPVASLTLWGPDLFRTFAKPALTRLCQGIRDITGKAPGLHICGETCLVWPDIAETGYASFMVDEREDIGELKHAAGHAMAISGNVPPVTVLLQGGIDDVLQAAKLCIQKAADSPMGYTLAAGCQIPPGVPMENLHALLLAAKKYGRGAQKGHPCREAFDHKST